jgi:hypothetical protein
MGNYHNELGFLEESGPFIDGFMLVGALWSDGGK